MKLQLHFGLILIGVAIGYVSNNFGIHPLVIVLCLGLGLGMIFAYREYGNDYGIRTVKRRGKN